MSRGGVGPIAGEIPVPAVPQGDLMPAVAVLERLLLVHALPHRRPQRVLLLPREHRRIGAAQALELHVFADGVVEQSHRPGQTILPSPLAPGDYTSDSRAVPTA